MFNYNAEGIDVESGFKVATEGEYNIVIRDTQEKTTKVKEDGTGGYPMVSVRCEIDDTGEALGVSFFHNVTFIPKGQKGAGMALFFLKAIGEPVEGNLEVDPQRWIGKRFKAKVNVGEYKGKRRNEIAYLIVNEESTDDIPF